MKTPKRDAVNLTGINHIHVPLLRRQIHARWKRKNRIAQLKRTIARQAEEIHHLRTLVTIRIQREYIESQKASLEWAANHICAHIHPADFTTEREDSSPVINIRCPLPTITFNRSTGLLVPTTPKQP